MFRKLFQNLIQKRLAYAKEKDLEYRINHIDDRNKSRITENTRLTSEQISAIEQLWGKYRHIRYDAHTFYYEKTGIFSPLFIPDSIHYKLIDPYFNDWTLAKYIDNKCYYHRIFKGVKTPKMVAYRLNGFWYNSADEISSYEKSVESVMATEVCFIKKATQSYGGKGVFYFSPKTQTKDELLKILQSIPSDLVIQEGVKQSAVLAKLNETSVNTVRLISLLRKDGTVKVYSGVFRMGINGSKVDNQSSGGITCGIEEDGRLKGVAYGSFGMGPKHVEHPTSHVRFPDVVIPGYEALKDLVKILHPQVPHFRLVSWDFALNKANEPELIEVNLCDGGLDLHQLNNGPLFGEDTEAILNEVFLQNTGK